MMKRTVVTMSMLALATAAHAQLLVVRATGPSAGSYAPGKMLPATGTVTLAAGDEVVVMDGAGTRSLKGPGSFPAQGGASTSAGLGTTLASLGERTTSRMARTGAIRGGGPAPALLPTLWSVDTTTGGTFCLVDGADAQLWRADTSAAGSVPVRKGDDGGPAYASFDAGAATTRWPATNAPRADGEYLVGPDANAQSVTIHMLADAPGDLATLAAAFGRMGCQRQIAFLRAAAGPAAP